LSVLAITGGTGFVGSILIDLALAGAHRIRALTRRPQPPRDGVIWVEGALDTPDAHDRLVSGADAVIHVAGVVNAPSRSEFARGNIDGTRAMIAAATRAGIQRFVQVSSLAAREPKLSAYGWSKAEADELVTASALDWTIVRPPAVYGPGDMEMFELFRLADKGLALLPPGGRLSVIHVADLARLLLTLAEGDPGKHVYEPDDGHDGGWSHAEFAHAIGAAVGKRVRPFAMPRWAMRAAARADGLVRGDKAKLTRDRVDYFCHPDWTATNGAKPPADLWQPQIATPQGLADTAAWYRARGLL
jgi:nucleoside-diphosphate-sugar epimerase